MTNIYRLDIYDLAGAQQYVLDLKQAPTTLQYARRVNAPGKVAFTIAGDHPLLLDIEDKWQVEVWRKPSGGDWGRELTAFYRDLNPWEYTDKSTARLECDGILSMLSWRHVAYYAGVANRSVFRSKEVETIANTLVTYNATTSGTTGDGRIRAAAGGYPFTGLSVEADGADGSAIDWYCSYANLLETLQKLVQGSGDFDIVKTSSTAWQFRYYHGQLGTDKSAVVTFALNRGNMKRPEYRDVRSKEVTVALVAGQGEDLDRDVVVRTGTNYSAGNDIEIFVPAPDIDKDDTAGLNARGDALLSSREAVKSFEFGVLDTPPTRYQIDYGLGDIVAVINPYLGTTYNVKVMAVAVSLDSDGEEELEIGVSETL